jgi:uncharacterized membrane protein
MNGEFIHPNWHVILIHYPLGLLTIGLIIELLSLGWPRAGFRAAGRWMILLGGLLSVPTALAGVYAYRDVVVTRPIVPDLKWHEVVDRSRWSANQWESLSDHVWLNSLGAVAFAAVVVAWLAGTDTWRRRAYWPLMAVLLIGVGLLMAGAWHGGEMVYRYGTGVELAVPSAEASAYNRATTGAPARDAHSRANQGEEPVASGVERYLPPLQLHMTLAGLAVAIALGALGLTIHVWPRTPGPRPTVGQAESTVPAHLHPAMTNVPRAPGEPQPVVVEPPRVFPGRFWLAAGVVAVVAAVAGAWSFMRGVSGAALRSNVELLKDPSHRRVLAHVIFGVSIVVITVVLAGLTRWARRQRAVAGVFASLLVLVVAVQVWLGVLMLFDSHEGPLTGFNAHTAAGATAHVRSPTESPRSGALSDAANAPNPE